MKLIFKQRVFSLWGSYDIYDENGNVFFTVKGKPALVQTLKIYDSVKNELGTIKRRFCSFLPKFDLYQKDVHFGCITKKFSFFKPTFEIDCNGWRVEGSFWEWDYRIYNAAGEEVAAISKELWQWTDTYIVNVKRFEDALPALMLVIAIDCEKASRD